jgi:1-deoxy-D-xylulose-5-phosphate synthase
VAVIGDGAFPSGMVYEAMNNIGGLNKKLVVVLNDNQMSICPRVGGMADYLDRLRLNPVYTGLKTELVKMLNKVPVFGDPVERFLAQLKEAAKAGLHGGMLFEELGLRYFGPIDGHNIRLLKKYLAMVKEEDSAVLLHVVTEKGHGFEPAEQDPVFFHTPPQFTHEENDVISFKTSSSRAYTHVASEAIRQQMNDNPRVTVMTAAMCQGNKLEKIREEFPDRFFDTGICESHAVAFAAGQAKAGLRPIVDIYSTFLQRSYDQIFQEVALQNLPVTFMLDRAGLTGPDGPTHHGMFDFATMRVLPGMVVMAPGDEDDLVGMLDLALRHDAPCSLRYPKAPVQQLSGRRAPVELGRAEVLDWGGDVCIIGCGSLVPTCVEAAKVLSDEGLDVGVVNARFVKPLDTETILRAAEQCRVVVTVEEAALAGGFGSAVVEAIADAGLEACKVRRLGIPDRFIEHGERSELLADLGLDASGIAQACRDGAAQSDFAKGAPSRRVS